MADEPVTQDGVVETRWRGMRVTHPAQWEPAGLSGHGEPGQIVLADRRHQRLQVQWKPAGAEPDLTRMFDDIRKSGKKPARDLAGVSGWTGLVIQHEPGHVTHAGRYFAARKILVQVILVWPGRRDEQCERRILGSIALWEDQPTVHWQALGLSLRLPRGYDLVRSSSLVGRIHWEFVRTAKPLAGLEVERIALPDFWLKTPLQDWLAGQVHKDYRRLECRATELHGHQAAIVISRAGNLAARLTRRHVIRADIAWRCNEQERVYRVAAFERGLNRPAWPEGLSVDCCRAMEVAGSP